MNRLHFVLLAVSLISFLTTLIAQNQGPRIMPARTIPVPDTVSPQMQKLIAAPLSPTWNVIPKTAAEWKAQVDAGRLPRCRLCRRCARNWASRSSR